LPSGAAPNILPAVGGKKGACSGRFYRRGSAFENAGQTVVGSFWSRAWFSQGRDLGRDLGWGLAAAGHPEPWQFGFQVSASPVMDDIIWFTISCCG